jgi:hypothetical protein
MWPWLLFAALALAVALFFSSRRRRGRDDDAKVVPPASPESAPADPLADAPADLDDEAPPAAEKAAREPTVASFSHRRHWAILEDVEDAHDFLLRIFRQLLSEGSGAGALVHGELLHLVDNRGHLMFSALVRRTEQLELIAMYPYSESAHTWPLQVLKIEESADRLQGRLLGSCEGAEVAVFDTLYMKNRDAYRLGETYPVKVSAIAYQLEPDQLSEEFAPDFAGFGPLSRFSKDSEATPDEIVFHGFIEDVSETAFWGVPLRVYTIPLHQPEEGKAPLRVTVYVHDAVADRPFTIGERVRGVLWLFAMWPTPSPPAVAADASQLN